MSEIKVPYNFVIKQNLSEEVCRIHREKYDSGAFVNGGFTYLRFKENDDYESRYSYSIPEGYVELNLEQFNEIFMPKTVEKPFRKYGEITYDMINTHKYFKTLTEEELQYIINFMDFDGYTLLNGALSEDKAKLLIEKFKTEIMPETAEKEKINNQINNKTMQVTCISSGSTKNLTEGNSYEVVEENDSFYYVANDKGVTTRYNKKLFKPEEVVPVEPPKPVIKEVALKIEHFSLHGSFDSGSNGVQLRVSVEGINKQSNNLMIIRSCDYSCGILEINGFNELVSRFNSYVRELLNEGAAHKLNITIENKFAIFESLFKNLIDELFEENDSKGIILMSSNITDNSALTFLCDTSDTDAIYEMVSGLFANSTYTENPNSGNMIFLGVSVR